MLLHNAKPDAGQTDAEDGYLLLTVLVMIFLVLLALSIAAPKLAKQIQRDKEQEAVQRGLQYRRAIQLYYKKFSAYPTDIKQLEKTNEIRFLRKRYKDPITGKDDWRLIHVGEAKVPPLGFFGQPLQTGLSSTSTGPGQPGSIYAPTNTDGSGGTNGSSTGSSTGLSNGSSSGSDSSSGSSSSFGFSNSGSSSGSSGGFGSSSGGFGSSGSSFGPSSGGSGSSGGFGSPGSGSVGTPTGTLGTNINSNGSTFGGAGPIVGVGLPVKKDSLLLYHKQKKYSDWEFVYDPQTDLMMNAGAITNGGNVNGTNSSNPAGGGTPGSNGSSFGSSGSSGSSGSGFGNFGSSGSGSGSGGFGNGGSGGSSGSGFGNFGSSGSGSNGGSGLGTPNSPQQ